MHEPDPDWVYGELASIKRVCSREISQVLEYLAGGGGALSDDIAWSLASLNEEGALLASALLRQGVDDPPPAYQAFQEFLAESQRAASDSEAVDRAVAACGRFIDGVDAHPLSDPNSPEFQAREAAITQQLDVSAFAHEVEELAALLGMTDPQAVARGDDPFERAALAAIGTVEAAIEVVNAGGLAEEE